MTAEVINLADRVRALGDGTADTSEDTSDDTSFDAEWHRMESINACRKACLPEPETVDAIRREGGA